MAVQAACRGGSFAVESVAAFAWNGWQASSGISGNLGLEYASEFSASDPQAVSVLSNGAQDNFSAVSVFEGRKRLIVHNDAHHPYRQAANIAHELSHAILLHPPTPPFTGDGERNFNAEVRSMEEEANWLGPALLVSEEAALQIVRNKMSMSDASKLYSASEQLITMRINVTGARKRTSRFRRPK